ncbi:MAG: hypothetical protein GX129_10350 [Clostridiales bacterium]|jgi:hypothetical protein|nr:hypothetical protein [Clostridiales bacterium]
MRKLLVLLLIFLLCGFSFIGCELEASEPDTSFTDESKSDASNTDTSLSDIPVEESIDANPIDNNEVNEANPLDNSIKELEELEEVWIETEYEAYETGILDVRVKWYNTLNDEMMFGEFYTLEEKINGSWEKVSKETDINYGFNAIGYGLGTNDARWHTYHLIPYTDGLPLGDYRISASFSRMTLDGNDYGAGKYPDYQVYGYFNVGDTMIKRNITILDDSKIEYLNEEYNFGIYLPKEWEGLQTSTSKETGDEDLDELFRKIDDEFIVMNIRHPKWTVEEPYQDISFAIFRTEQWNDNVAAAVNDDFDLLPLQIPGGGHEFVFRSNPMAYNSSFKGHEEVVEIVGDGHFNSSIHDY